MADDDNIVRLATLQGRGPTPGSEDAIALAFAADHANTLRYVAKWNQWFRFDGTCWREDTTLHVFDLIRGLCRDAGHECGKQATAKLVAAVHTLVRADRRLAATVEQWDAAPRLLVDAGGTIELLDGSRRESRPDDYITKQATCIAAPAGTPHPLWTAFLARVTANNAELQGFLQRYVGYCLTGDTHEHAFAFAYGTGANGKGTFINTIQRILGNYSTTADMRTFVATKNEQHQTDVAKLAGARLVVAQETEKGRRWDETKLKTLTGGDQLTARFMRQDFFDFVPTFKLFITGNHKPRLNSVDEAMRRRLLVVPFTVQIPPAERDPKLKDKLVAEHPAILRWCIDGCLEWQRVGLAPPPSVRATTDTYFADQDLIAQWLDERCNDALAATFTRTADLFASWKAWCETNNIPPGSANALSDTLADRGHTRTRHGKQRDRGFYGLEVR
jgi:putative DNA primase/helicase